MSTRHQRTAAQFAEANRRAAEAILEDPARYGGDGAAMVEWARAVLEINPITLSQSPMHAAKNRAYDWCR